jgi:glycosyltransferase involved in cell wall biosynthesis
MFYGKAVCSFLSYDFFKTYPDCPIIESTIDNLKEKLVWLIEHPDERVRIGKEGRAFVEKYCDREKINQRILKVYQGLFKGLSA